MDFGVASVASITVIAYLGGAIVKAKLPSIDNDNIPTICGTIGGVVGMIGYAIKMPDFPANDVITALAVGIVSGLAATGINQIVKVGEKNAKL